MKTKFKTHEVCEMLGIPKQTLYNWQANGNVPKPPRTAMGVRYYLLSDIKGILDSPCASDCKEHFKSYIQKLHEHANELLNLL